MCMVQMYAYLCPRVHTYTCLCSCGQGAIAEVDTKNLLIILHFMRGGRVSHWSQPFQFQLLSPCKLRSLVGSHAPRDFLCALGIWILFIALVQQSHHLLGHRLTKGLRCFHSTAAGEIYIFPQYYSKNKGYFYMFFTKLLTIKSSL